MRRVLALALAASLGAGAGAGAGGSGADAGDGASSFSGGSELLLPLIVFGNYLLFITFGRRR